MERPEHSEFSTFSDMLKKQGVCAYANTAHGAKTVNDASEFAGYESLDFAVEQNAKTEKAADYATAISNIATTVHRLKITCIAQLVLLLIAVTAFAIYEAERKPTALGDKQITGHWSDWPRWTVCSKSCGTGLSNRQRNCTVEKQESLFRLCMGVSVEEKLCETSPCSVSGNWSDWTSWSSCSVSCGSGTTQRFRFCTNQTPNDGGTDCNGQSLEEKICKSVNCVRPHSAFTVFGPQNGPSPGTLKFMNITTNIGRHYNESTGQYVCEYAGLYVFALHLYKYPAIFDYVECYIRMNGVEQMKVFNNPDVDSDVGNYEATGSVVLHLSPGDVVDLGASTSISAMDSWTAFTGFLLVTD